MDYSQIARCINWLVPVSNSYDGVLRILPDAICAVSTTASAVARQSVLPMSGKPYGVSDKIMQLIDWKRVGDAQLDKTRLVITYGNGDTVRVPLVELDDDVTIQAADVASDELEWIEFPYVDKLKWLLDTTARDKPTFGSIHFIGAGMYSSLGPVITRGKRAAIETDYGKFLLPLHAAEYIAKLRGAIEVALYGSVDWTSNDGNVIGCGPSTIFVRSDGMIYSAQLYNMAPTPHNEFWSKIDAMVQYRGVVTESMLHYMKLAAAIDSAKVSPTFTVNFSKDKLSVSFADKDGGINGTVPITWDGNEWPDYEAYFAVSEWLDRGGDVEVGFCDTGARPMVIYYAPGMDIAVMPRSKKARG